MSSVYNLFKPVETLVGEAELEVAEMKIFGFSFE